MVRPIQETVYQGPLSHGCAQKSPIPTTARKAVTRATRAKAGASKRRPAAPPKSRKKGRGCPARARRVVRSYATRATSGKRRRAEDPELREVAATGFEENHPKRPRKDESAERRSPFQDAAGSAASSPREAKKQTKAKEKKAAASPGSEEGIYGMAESGNDSTTKNNKTKEVAQAKQQPLREASDLSVNPRARERPKKRTTCKSRAPARKTKAKRGGKGKAAQRRKGRPVKIQKCWKCGGKVRKTSKRRQSPQSDLTQETSPSASPVAAKNSESASKMDASSQDLEM